MQVVNTRDGSSCGARTKSLSVAKCTDVSHPMKLTYDVFVAVMHFQSLDGRNSDLSSISRACRALHYEGVKHLLASGVKLRDEKDVISFGLFMLADVDRLYPFLRCSLSIETGLLSRKAALALLNLVQGITHLDRLVLTDADKILGSHLLLPDAFAGLSCLKHLELSVSEGGEGKGCLQMFRRMRSPLVTASIHLPTTMPRWLNGESNGQLVDPISLLRNSAGTLTELTGYSLEAQQHDIIYPRMKRLQVHLGLVPFIVPYIVSFPNLSSLEVVCDGTTDQAVLPVFAYLNEDSQTQFGCWTALEELSGKSNDLYALSLRCKVANLRVDASSWHGALHYLTNVLSRAMPSHLQLKVTPHAFLEDDLSNVLLRSEAIQSVDSLYMQVILRGVDDCDLGRLLACAVRTVERLELTSFTIHFQHDDCDGRLPGCVVGAMQPDAEPSSDLVLRNATGGLRVPEPWEQEVSQHAEHLQQACPKLRQFVVEESSCTVAPQAVFAIEFLRD